MKHFLSDEWSLEGRDKMEFRDRIREIDDNTSFVKVNFADIIVNSLYQNADGTVSCYCIDPASVLADGCLEYADTELTETISNTIGENMAKETLENGLFFTYKRDDHWHLISTMAYATLGQRIQLPATAMQYKSLARDCMIAEYIGHHPACNSATAVVKQSGGIQKVFAFLTTKYKPIPLDALNDVTIALIDESKLGESECLGWTINHDIVRIDYAFVDYADEISDLYSLPERMTPCVRLMSSDIGECSVRAVGYWKTDDGDIIWGDEYARPHRGNLETAVIVKEVEENIFDKYAIYPQKLKSLSYIQITPKNLNLEKAGGRAANRKLLTKVYMKALMMLGVTPILGKKRMGELREALTTALIADDEQYSAYAIAKDIIALPRRMRAWWSGSDLTSQTLEKFQKAASRVAFLDFQDIVNKATNKSAGYEVYLTPDDEEE